MGRPQRRIQLRLASSRLVFSEQVVRGTRGDFSTRLLGGTSSIVGLITMETINGKWRFRRFFSADTELPRSWKNGREFFSSATQNPLGAEKLVRSCSPGEKRPSDGPSILCTKPFSGGALGRDKIMKTQRRVALPFGKRQNAAGRDGERSRPRERKRKKNHKRRGSRQSIRAGARKSSGWDRLVALIGLRSFVFSFFARVLRGFWNL